MTSVLGLTSPSEPLHCGTFMSVQTRTSPGLAARSYCRAVWNPKPPPLRAALSWKLPIHSPSGMLTSQNGTFLSATWHPGHYQARDLSSNMFIDWKEKWRRQTITQPVFTLCLDWVQGSNVWVYVNLSATLGRIFVTSCSCLPSLHTAHILKGPAEELKLTPPIHRVYFFNFKKCTIFMCVSDLPPWMPVCHVYTSCLWRSLPGSLGTRVTEGVGIEPRSSVRAAATPHHCGISPVPL